MKEVYKLLCVILLQHDNLLGISNIKMLNVTHRYLSITWYFIPDQDIYQIASMLL